MEIKSKRKSNKESAAMKEMLLEDTKRINANVPESLHQRLKIKAAQNRTTVNELIIKWSFEYVSK